MSKQDTAKAIIKRTLYTHGALGFNQLVSITKLNRRTVNINLHALEAEHQPVVQKDKGSRGKWRLTESSSQRLLFEELANQIRASTVYIEPPVSEKPTTSTYLLMEVNKSGKPLDANPNSDPMKNNFSRASVDFVTFSYRVQSHPLDLTEKDLKEIARKEGLAVMENDATLKEKVLKALSERLKRIIFIEVLDPAFMLEEMERKKNELSVAKSLTENKCSECGSQNLVYDCENGETACGECGLVMHSRLFL